MSVLRTAIALILAGGSASALADQITCESHRIGGAEPCGTVAAGTTVTLARQLSGPACVEGKTWGTGPDHDSIWVSGGCRAVFDVQPPYGGASTRSEPRDDNGYDNGRADSRTARNSYHADEPVDDNGDDDADAPQQSDDRDASPPPRDDRYAAAPRDDRYAQDRDDARDENDIDRQDRGADDRDYRSSDDRGSRRYARAERHDNARQACIDQAAVGQRFGPEQIEASDARRVGHGMYSVDLDTPTGRVECTVDRDGRVQSLDNE